MSKITFQDKENLQSNPSVLRINKVIDEDINEIKKVVNNNDTNTNNNFSDAYDDSLTYNVGDYCIYDDKLKKCITEITTAESFDNSKWEDVNIANNLTQYYTHVLTAVSGSLAANGWRNIYASITTDVIEPGTYIIVLTANVVGSGNGAATGRITIDGLELSGFQRSSIPLNSSVMSTNITGVWTPTERKSYLINAQVYGTVSYTVQYSSTLHLVKIA